MAVHPSLSMAEPVSLWLDRSPQRPEREPLIGARRTDLAIVGGGFTGLWAALIAKERDPSREVVLLESDRMVGAASGRNGGFCSASLTHGIANGVTRFPKEVHRLQHLGEANFSAIRSAIETYAIDCDWHEPGQLEVATAPYLVDELPEIAELCRRFGIPVTVLDRSETQRELAGANYEGSVWVQSGEALIDPVQLGLGLWRAAEAAGVEVYERTPMTELIDRGDCVEVRTAHGVLTARRVVLGTNAFRSPVRKINSTVVPVYDYVLATEPLNDEQMKAIGWSNRQGIADLTNQFHYYRMTKDRRIVWGGYDAVYYYGSAIDPTLDLNDQTHSTLATHFFDTFPQLEGLRFTHRWGGVIDTCTRFSVSFGTTCRGKVAYAVGYTGLGVGATRFGASTCLDLLDDPGADVCSLELVRKRPMPFPPEPVRSLGINLTRRAIAQADRNEGRRNLWLRVLDRLGLGFDS